jgi:large subunit ribosomal protein L21
MNFAVIKTGGKQYKVAEGDKLKVEKLDVLDGEINFEDVLLLVQDDKIQIGQPRVPGAKVVAQVLSYGKREKKMVFRYKSKTRQRKKKGHRQLFTEVKITKISP